MRKDCYIASLSSFLATPCTGTITTWIDTYQNPSSGWLGFHRWPQLPGFMRLLQCLMGLQGAQMFLLLYIYSIYISHKCGHYASMCHAIFALSSSVIETHCSVSRHTLFSQLFLGDPKTFPGQVRYVIPPACLGLHWDLLQDEVPGIPPQGAVQMASGSHFQTSSNWLISVHRRNGSTPSSSQMSAFLILILIENEPSHLGRIGFWPCLSVIPFFQPLPKPPNHRLKVRT